MQIEFKDIDELIAAIHDGRYSTNVLPEELYYAIADALKKGLYEGFGTTISDLSFSDVDFSLLSELRDNIYMFSGAKTYQQVREMTDLLMGDSGILPFNKFRDEALAIFDKYNVSWLQAEYNTALGQGQMANKWSTIMSEQDVLPMLRYDAIGDACPICKPLDGIVAPVNHSIWRKASPLNHFNCFCILIQETGKATDANRLFGIEQQFQQVVSPEFNMNPYFDKVVFNENSSYFTNVPNKDRFLAMNNFNLPIPPND